jgi:hypothetical protein
MGYIRVPFFLPEVLNACIEEENEEEELGLVSA